MAICIIALIIFLAFLFTLAGIAGVISKDHLGNNWGRNHMKDLGLDDYKDDDNLKPF